MADFFDEFGVFRQVIFGFYYEGEPVTVGCNRLRMKYVANFYKMKKFNTLM